jgi:alkylated DNA repair dioxygenase AlkB
MQIALFDKQKPIGEDCPPIVLILKFLGYTDAYRLKQLCLEQMDWQQNEIRMYGKPIPLPRLEAIAAKKQLTYTYSGSVKLEAKALPPFLAELMREVERESKALFDLVIGNHYKTGSQYIGWHADKEPLMGDRPTIASISLGAERKFQLRRKGKGTQIFDYNLPHGSLLIMNEGCQQEWIHQLPASNKVMSDRVNLTFRPWMI